MTDTRIVKRVEDMPVYGIVYELSLDIERASRAFPREFAWLRSQTTRSSESVAANLTEGFYAQYTTEYLQSLFRARREARETLTHLTYAHDCGLLDDETFGLFVARYEDGMQQLSNLIRSLENKIQLYGKGRPPLAAREETETYEISSSSPMNHQP